nr:two-component response regulator ORR26-like [Ipomoea trifida]
MSPEVQSSPSITGAVTGDPSSQPPADRQYLAIGAAAAFVSKLESSSPPSAAVQPAVVATAVGTFTATSGQASIVGSVNYGPGGILQALGCGGSGGSLFRNKDAFTDDPNNNTTAGDDSFVTPQPPRIHRRLQSADEFFSFNDVDYEYLIQGFSDNNARQAGVALQAPTHNNTSSSEFNDKACFNPVQFQSSGDGFEPNSYRGGFCTGGILQALGCGGGGSLFRNKDAFTDDPNNNTTAGDDSFVTPQPPRIHRRLQSADEFFSFNDVDYEYLIQGFSDNNARQAGVALQAPTHNNTSSSEFNDKAVPVLDCATAAISVLSRKEEKFDAVIASIHSPDMQAYKLLREAVSMDLLVIFLCDEEDAEMAVRLIEHGAFLLLHKPICDQLIC